jgi:putative ABC transport system ATP-binding protein
VSLDAEALVACRTLSKTYATSTGEIEALHSVTASFEAGRVAAIVGASGSGKSTLLRAVAGLDRPTSGELRIAGRDLVGASATTLRAHRLECVTYVAQKPSDNFIPHLTLAEHAADEPEAARALLRDVGLEHRLGSLPIELSGGEQARAAVALALGRETPLIVIDEPTAELDEDSGHLLLDAIRRHAGAGVAFLVATHDPEVTRIADSVIRLERGRVVTSAPARADEQPATHEATNEPIVLQALALAKTYAHGGADIHAVSDATLELRRGELGVLLGRSGSGKSTLLTLLAGWQQPDTGTILRDGRTTDTSSLAWAELGYLPQRFGLIPELSVRENVELPARLAGLRTELAGRVDELLRDLGLDELADRRPPETSIGQQQRTALARALILRPAVLLADEPSSHQDARWHAAVWALLARASAEGTACLIATHEPEAARNASQVWEIGDGVVARRSQGS